MKRLISKGELVAIFPEGLEGLSKPFHERYRLQEFDWTRLLPAVEEGVKIYPLSTVGADEAVPLSFLSGRSFPLRLTSRFILSRSISPREKVIGEW
jgi:hypothetical protein